VSDVSAADAPVADAPVVDAPVESAPEAPTFEAPAEGVPAVENAEPTAPVEEAPAAPAVADPYEEFGGRQEVERALRMYQHAQTDDGVVDLFLEAGRSLGLSHEAMQTLFNDLAGEAPEAPDPDEPLTRGEFQAELERRQQAAAAAEAQRVRATAEAAVQQELTALGLKVDDPQTQVILTLGDRHLKGKTDAESIRAAVRAGHADFQAQVETEAKRYLQTKQQQAASVPSAPAGSGAPAEPPPAEPRDVAEAIKAVRRRLASG
jgi:hypothetical protein